MAVPIEAVYTRLLQTAEIEARAREQAAAELAAQAAIRAFRLAHVDANAATIRTEILRVAAQHTDVNSTAMAVPIEAVYTRLLQTAEIEARAREQAAAELVIRQAAETAILAFRTAHVDANAATIHTEILRVAAQHTDVNGTAMTAPIEVVYTRLLQAAEIEARAREQAAAKTAVLSRPAF
jgi:predicted deacetylase